MRVVILHANERHQLADRPVLRTYGAAPAAEGMLQPPGAPGTAALSHIRLVEGGSPAHAALASSSSSSQRRLPVPSGLCKPV